MSTATAIDPRRVSSSSPEGMMPVVFIVVDDAAVRDSLCALVCRVGWRAATFASGVEFLTYPPILAPSCLVLDTHLPDMNGLELQRRIAIARTYLSIVFVTGRSDIALTVHAMKAGAIDFLVRPFGEDVILNAMQTAIERSEVTLRLEREMETARCYYASLTPRQRELMALVASGMKNKHIGSELGIGEATVKAHRSKMMQKMRVGSVANLVAMAGKLKLDADSRNADSAGLED